MSENSVQIIQSMYEGANTVVRTPHGETARFEKDVDYIKVQR